MNEDENTNELLHLLLDEQQKTNRLLVDLIKLIGEEGEQTRSYILMFSDSTEV